MKRNLVVNFSHRFLALYLIVCGYLCGQQQLTHYKFCSSLHHARQQKQSKKENLVVVKWWCLRSERKCPKSPKAGFCIREKSFENFMFLDFRDFAALWRTFKFCGNVVPTHRINTAAENQHLDHDVMTWGNAQIKYKYIQYSQHSRLKPIKIMLFTQWHSHYVFLNFIIN